VQKCKGLWLVARTRGKQRLSVRGLCSFVPKRWRVTYLYTIFFWRVLTMRKWVVCCAVGAAVHWACYVHTGESRLVSMAQHCIVTCLWAFCHWDRVIYDALRALHNRNRVEFWDAVAHASRVVMVVGMTLFAYWVPVFGTTAHFFRALWTPGVYHALVPLACVLAAERAARLCLRLRRTPSRPDARADGGANATANARAFATPDGGANATANTGANRAPLVVAVAAAVVEGCEGVLACVFPLTTLVEQVCERHLASRARAAEEWQRALWTAAQRNDVAEVRRKLCTAPDERAGDARELALAVAAANNHTECVQELLKAGTCPNRPIFGGDVHRLGYGQYSCRTYMPPLCWAATHGAAGVESARLLLAHKAYAETVEYPFVSALREAVQSTASAGPMVQLLVSAKAFVNHQGHGSHLYGNHMFRAFHAGTCVDTVRTLLAAKAKCPQDSEWLVRPAALCSAPVIQLLVEARASAEACTAAVVTALYNTDAPGIVRVLLEAKACMPLLNDDALKRVRKLGRTDAALHLLIARARTCSTAE